VTRTGDAAPIIEPGTAQEFALALRDASARRQSVLIRGAGTKMDWGSTPAAIDVILSTRRMNRLLAHQHGDLTATAEAGATLAGMNRTLAEHRQWLPLDPPFADRATIGGILATNDSGPLRHRFGTPRDLVIGVELVTTDGALAKAGGRVVKNVAGYDLPRLAVGAAGRLGEIARACVRLHPLPAATRTVVVERVDPLVLEPLAPACVEYAWPPGHMLVRFESPAAAELARQARALVGGTIVEDDEELWAVHREVAAGLPVHRALPADAPAAIEELRTSGATRIVGRLARGILHANVQQRGQTPMLQPDVQQRGQTPMLQLERRVVEAFGG
jgi:glycolate oxidase FAD binding subunit